MSSPRFLTAAEELMFVDDRPAYPSCCFLRTTFSGCLTRVALEEAMQIALHRHPLLRAMVVRRRRRLEWAFVEKPKPKVKWIDSPNHGEDPPAGGIDLTTEIGIRVRVIANTSGSELTVQFHHSACDGKGILRFFEDLLSAYASVVAADRSNLPAGAEVNARHQSRVQLLHLLDGFRHGWTTVRRKPSPLLPHVAARNDSAIGSPYPAMIGESFTAEETDALLATAKELGVTVNDLLLTSAFLAIDDWRQVNGVKRDNWIRMLSPADMRSAKERNYPAANIVSGYFLDRCAADFADADRLLRSVHQEMTCNKQRQFGRMFQLAVELCRYFPGGLRKQVLANKCLVSLVLTNLGRVLKDSTLPRCRGAVVAGNVILNSVEIAPPLRPYVCASFSAATYADRITLTVHFDPRLMTSRQAQDLLAAFLARLRSWSVTQASFAPEEAHSGV
jgi:NRPS condensation-like uncharacterized protein